MPKYCPECGETVKEGTNFCKKCGHKFFEKVAPTPTRTQTNSATEDQNKHSGFGITALVLGIISMCLIWLSFFTPFYFVVELPMGIIATILGAVGYWGKWKDKFGLAGFILGLLVIVIGMIFVLLVTTVYVINYY
ncbi:MAG: zinc-ribbon domain-containing protein [Thermoplasmatales archaeon]|nr:MAG: zinc-ribbon domain-containing protein [Thermoplasmatales archaeon]